MIAEPKQVDKLIPLLKSKPLILYGMGGGSLIISQWCDEYGIDYLFSDQNPQKATARMDKVFIQPERIVFEYPHANVVIASIFYFDDIKLRLLSYGIPVEQILSYSLFFKESVTWKELEYKTIWGENEERIKQIASFIPSNVKSVVDYGEGKSRIKKYLAPDIKYYPIDYVNRSNETILCDFDTDEYPEIECEVSICTSTLVFINKAKQLLNHICQFTTQVLILSYVTVDTISNRIGRRTSGYVNDFTIEDLVDQCGNNGFVLTEKCMDQSNQIDTIFVFKKTDLGDNL